MDHAASTQYTTTVNCVVEASCNVVYGNKSNRVYEKNVPSLKCVTFLDLRSLTAAGVSMKILSMIHEISEVASRT